MKTITFLMLTLAGVILTACLSPDVVGTPAPTAPKVVAAVGPLAIDVVRTVPSVDWKNVPVADEAKAAAYDVGPGVTLRFYQYQAPGEKNPSTLYISVKGSGYHLVSFTRKQDRTFSVLGLAGSPQDIAIGAMTYLVAVTGYQQVSCYLRLPADGGFQAGCR